MGHSHLPQTRQRESASRRMPRVTTHAGCSCHRGRRARILKSTVPTTSAVCGEAIARVARWPMPNTCRCTSDIGGTTMSCGRALPTAHRRPAACTTADDCFAQADAAELTIGLATTDLSALAGFGRAAPGDCCSSSKRPRRVSRSCLRLARAACCRDGVGAGIAPCVRHRGCATGTICGATAKCRPRTRRRPSRSGS